MSQVTTLPFSPRPAQKIIFDLFRDYRFVTAVCHRRLGKTRGAVAWLCEQGLSHRDYSLPFRGYYFAKTKQQAKTVCWLFFKQLLGPLRDAGLVKFNETNSRIDLPNDGAIYLRSGEPDSVEDARGMYAHRIVMDELASWRDPYYAFEEVIRPALMDTHGKCLFIGTVKGLDLLFEFYKRGGDPEFNSWASVLFKASETGILTKKELEEYKREMRHNPAGYAREMECDFFAEGDTVMINPIDVQPAINRPMLRDEYIDFTVKLGIDPGITSDPTEVCIRQGPKLHGILQFNQPDHDLLAQEIVSKIIPEWRPQSIAIDTGRGEQLIIALNKRRYLLRGAYIVPVQFNAPSPSPACYNMRTWIYYQTRMWFASQYTPSIPNDEELIRELTNQLLDEESTGSVFRLAPKKKIAAIINHSPNKSDALAVSMAEGVESGPNRMKAVKADIERAKADLRRMSGDIGEDTKYDPYNHFKSQG